MAFNYGYFVQQKQTFGIGKSGKGGGISHTLAVKQKIAIINVYCHLISITQQIVGEKKYAAYMPHHSNDFARIFFAKFNYILIRESERRKIVS
jgi:hypothetical protein